MRDLPQFLQHLKSLEFTARTVVDVGVAYGTPPLYQAYPDAYFLLFEPIEEFAPHIERFLKKHRGEYHRCALADKSGTATIYRPSQQADGASLMHRGVDKSSPQLREVQVCTLDELLGDRQLEGPILLKTDCQGADLKVIQGGLRFAQQCDVIIMEIGMFHYWGPDTPDLADVVGFMKGQGFVPYEFVGSMNRVLDGALGQVDIAFVKERGRFRKVHQW